MIVPPFFMYAETHYRFKYFFSLLKKNEPEIIADAPHRLEPDSPLPVMLLVKDADRYPVTLTGAQFTVKKKGSAQFVFSFHPDEPITINEKFWWKIVDIPFDGVHQDLFGRIDVVAAMTILMNGKTKIITTNNHRTSSKLPLSVYRSADPLPSFPGWIFGDAHTHSTYTDDQVEFGSPVPAGPTLCKAMGLSFFCVTDHSYDLDDSLDSYLRNDPFLPKWKLFQDEVYSVNQGEKDFAVIRGEEVTCRNSDHHNVHLLLLGTRSFFHGSGDSAEQWLNTRSENSVTEVLSAAEGNVASYAAHPTEVVPLLQRLLINRGEWTKKDMNEPSLHGIQILNGEHSEHFVYGMDVWKWLLLKGEKKFILAGNDAHGNYNRFVQIGIPFFAIREKDTQLFGKMKTAVFASPSEESIVNGLQKGKTVITNGPLLTIELETDSGAVGTIGDSIRGKRFLVKVRAQSTKEYGRLKSIKLYLGIIGKREKEFRTLRTFGDPLKAHFITDWESVENFSYIRAELMTKEADGSDIDGFCYTNPIWIQPA